MLSWRTWQLEGSGNTRTVTAPHVPILLAAYHRYTRKLQASSSREQGMRMKIIAQPLPRYRELQKSEREKPQRGGTNQRTLKKSYANSEQSISLRT